MEVEQQNDSKRIQCIMDAYADPEKVWHSDWHLFAIELEARLGHQQLSQEKWLSLYHTVKEARDWELEIQESQQTMLTDLWA